MIGKENFRGAGDMLRDIHDFAQEDGEEIKSMSLKKVNDELISAKINIGNPSDKVLEIFAKVKARELLVHAAEERLQLLKIFQTNIYSSDDSFHKIKESLVVLVNKMFAKEQAFVYCRKFENATKEDIQTLIADLMLLNEIETKSRANVS